jgi:acyl-CoA reductase-like NAD-dependent aldehyde dehydrogenase
MLRRYEEDIYLAVYEDLHKPRFEMRTAEMDLIYGEIDFALEHLKDWARPRDVPLPGRFLKDRGIIYPEPYGVALIIAPWNYPFLLLISPLTGSIAAGNCSVLKPSEISGNSSRLAAEMIAETYDPAFVTAIEGGVEVGQDLLGHKFDYIFFTGSTSVGKAVMRAAADHLTPVTLELGGKSPCIVDKPVNVEDSASRIVWGKFMNAGQTCIAPDYLLVEKEVEAALLEAMQQKIGMFYGEDPAKSESYARIISGKHFERLSRMLRKGNIIIGGEQDRTRLYIAPTVMDGVAPESPLMQEEIFGPILPVFTYRGLDEAVSFVNSRPKPLALYFFSSDAKKQERILRETSAGGVAINSTLSQASTQTLPYGGVGDSGMGAYQGKASFDTFTHYKSAFVRNVACDDGPAPLYPHVEALKKCTSRAERRE